MSALTATSGGLMLTACASAPVDAPTPPTQLTVAIRPRGGMAGERESARWQRFRWLIGEAARKTRDRRK